VIPETNAAFRKRDLRQHSIHLVEQSPSGTWLAGTADRVSLSSALGWNHMGLSQHYGRIAVWIGIFLLIGSVLALVATFVQRRRATTLDKPNDCRHSSSPPMWFARESASK
jgi:hypothetical protein